MFRKFFSLAVTFLLFSQFLFAQERVPQGKTIEKDSIPSYRKTIALDTLNNRKDMGLNQYGIDLDGFHNSGPNYSEALYSIFPNLPMIYFNRVNGFFFGVKEDRMQWSRYNNGFLDIPNIHVHGMLGYATGLREWQYTFGLEKPIGWNRNFLLGAELFNATGTDDYWRVGLNETSVTALIAGYDFMDYYKQNGWGTYFLMRNEPYFKGGLAFISSQYNSLTRNTGWALVGAGDRYRVNPSIDYNRLLLPVVRDTAQISSLFLSASFNPQLYILSSTFTFSLTGTVEFADPGVGISDYNYSKYTGELITYFNFEPGGILKHRFRSSIITGEAPKFKQLYLGGIGTMRALPYKMMGAGNRMLLSNLEFQFGHPTNHNQRWIDFDDVYLSLFLDSGWVNMTDESNDFNLEDIKNNAGLGLGTNIIRGELAWNLDDPNSSPIFWIRLNPTF